jgi:two-component system, NtrC family, sensor kinase
MSEILRLISNSSSNIETVLRSVAEQAAHICRAQFVDILLVENDQLRDVAWFGELKRTLVVPLDRSTCEMRPVSIDDLQNAGDEFARGREIARRDGHRSMLAVPLIREGRAIGTIVIRRTEIRPFEQKDIALLTNFAAQAVIAIENARLLNELRESLQQQTATAEVLRVISSSPGELEPVFQSLLNNATRLCAADFGLMAQYDGTAFQLMAQFGADKDYVEYMRREPFRPGPETLAGRILQTRGPVQIEDFAKSKGYLDRDPLVVVAVERGGVRTTLGVPMLRENELIGVISIFRKEVRHSQTNRSNCYKISLPKPSSPSRTPVCLTSCASALMS